MSKEGFLDLSSDEIATAIAHLEQTGDRRLVPIYRAVRDFNIGVIYVRAAGPVPDMPAKVRQKPNIMIICDDMGRSLGPAAYDSRALRWMLNRSGAWLLASGYPPVAWYSACAGCAASGFDVVIVDTMQAHENAWFDYLNDHASEAKQFIVADSKGTLIHRIVGSSDGIDWTATMEAEKQALSDNGKPN